MSRRLLRHGVSLRTYLTALAVASALPLVVLQIRTSVRLYDGAVTRGELQARILAEATATSTEQFLNVSKGLMAGLASEMGPALLNTRRCDAVLRTVNGVMSFFANVMVADREGNIICSAVPMPGDLDPTVADRQWFRDVRAAGEFTVGPPALGRITDTWVIALAVPIRSADGSFAGALGGSIALARFQSLLTGVQLKPDELITIGDRKRVVVARSRDPEGYVGKLLPPAVDEERSLGPDRSITNARDFDGVVRTWSKVHLAPWDWDVYAGIPIQRIRGPALMEAGRQTGLGLLILLVAIGLAALVHGRISGWLQRLVEGTRDAAVGRPVPLPPGVPEEVEAVATQVNRSLEARSRAEEAERAAKERYRSIFDNAVFGIHRSTPSGRFLDVNPALVSLLGYDSAEELIAAGPRALYPDGSVRDELLAMHRDAEIIDDVEVDWLRRDGSPITVRLNGTIIRTESEEPAFEVIVEDITGERALEEELRHTQKMEAVGRLAGGVAHDFNNLLTVIGGNSQLLLSELPPESPMRVEVDEIADAASRAERLTRQLLAFSRKEKTQPRLLDPNELIRELEKMLGRLIGEDIRLETRLDPRAGAVLADPGQLEQVLVNLVVNARDAMRDGGRLTLETLAAVGPPGTAPRTAESRWVVVAVEDTGTGMSPEVRGRVFEPFFTTKPKDQGTGLGLATAYAIVAGAGGHLLVESEMGRGTRFEIWLPESAACARDSDEPDSLEPEDPATGTILIVEDEEPVRRLAQRVLKGAGYRVLTASDGWEALRLSERYNSVIDLVITDVVMPNVKGTELASRLAETRPETPVLFVSGYTDNLPLGDRVAADPDLFLPKPFTPRQLRARVRHLLDRGDAGGSQYRLRLVP